MKMRKKESEIAGKSGRYTFKHVVIINWLLISLLRMLFYDSEQGYGRQFADSLQGR